MVRGTWLRPNIYRRLHRESHPAVAGPPGHGADLPGQRPRLHQHGSLLPTGGQTHQAGTCEAHRERRRSRNYQTPRHQQIRFHPPVMTISLLIPPKILIVKKEKNT
uniref:(northern house mosquito) hypothetical protein n=1 Tax=Culex pipiens TaxID=7175 RepID=A0A8D8NJM2_CULPI